MNKGYTLIELLGVIIILILLTALVLPNVINSIKSANNKNDELAAEMIISATKIYMSDNFSDMRVDSGFTYCIPLTTLVENDYLQSPIKYNNINDVTGIKAVKINYIDSYSYSIVDKNQCSYIVYQEPNSTTFLKTTLLKSDIEEITVVDDLDLPSNTLNTFDVSDSGNGSILLWYTDADSNDLYEVYIGSNNGVVANSYSMGLFSDLPNVTSIDISELDTSKIIDSSSMFANTPKLDEIIMIDCDLSNIAKSDNMFKNTKNTITIRISSTNNTFITDNLTQSEVTNPNVIQSN